MASSEKSLNRPRLVYSWSLLPKSAELVRQYFVPLLYVSILPALLTELGSTYNHAFNVHSTDDSFSATIGLSAHNGSGLGGTLVLVGILWTLLSLAARYYVQLRATKGQPVEVAEAYRKTASRIVPLIALMIVYTIMVIVGLILLIVPGLIVIRRYYLAPYYLIDRNVSIREALRLSAQATKPISGYIWGIIGVSIVLAILAGFLANIPLGIGAVIATFVNVLYIFAPAFRYREAEQHKLA